MEIIDWNEINQYYLQEIYSIYDTLTDIEEENEKIKNIFLILFSRYYLDIEVIKKHIKAYYYLENMQYINVIDEVYNNIVIYSLIYNYNEEEFEEEEEEGTIENSLLNFINEIININNFENVTMVLNEQELNNIPENKYSEITTNFNSCSICQDEYNKDNIVRQLKCNHIYHKECIDKYLLEYSYKCPICRVECGKGIIKN